MRLWWAGLVVALGCHSGGPSRLGPDASGGADASGGDVASGGVSITVNLLAAPEALAAYRDGDGTWTTASVSSGSFNFSVQSGRYGVAIGCATSTAPYADIFEMTTDDAT